MNYQMKNPTAPPNPMTMPMTMPMPHKEPERIPIDVWLHGMFWFALAHPIQAYRKFIYFMAKWYPKWRRINWACKGCTRKIGQNNRIDNSEELHGKQNMDSNHGRLRN